MNLKVAQVVGLNTDQKAAQVTSSVRDGDNAFFGLVHLECDDAFTKGRQLLTDLADFYFDAEGSAAQKLSFTFNEAKQKLGEVPFHLVLGGVGGKILYLLGLGEVEVYLKRDSKLSQLLAIGGSQELISGFLNEGDRVFFLTKNLAALLGEEINKSFDIPLDSFEEEISNRLSQGEPEKLGVAGLMVEVQPALEEIPPLSKDETEVVEPYMQEERAKVGRLLRLGLTQVFQRFPKSGRARLILALVLILTIGVGAGLKYKSLQESQKQTLFRETLTASRDDFNAAKNLGSLNPAEAKAKLEEAKNKVNKALSLNPKSGEAQDLQKQIEEQSGTILQQMQVAEFPLFLDLDLIKKDFRSPKMSLSAGKLLLLDEAQKSLVTIDMSKKSHQILAGSEQLGEATGASLNGALAFVYAKDKGILRIDTGTKKLTTVAKKDEAWGNILDIYGFAGNVYLLDKEKNMIWKYLPTASGYSDKREYLTSQTKADFSNALRMQIESSIYVLKAGGEMLRFTKGDKDNFGYEGLPSSVKDPKSFFVSSDTDNLYLLDSGNQRLLILTKTGKYKGEMSGEKFGKASDLVVEEKGKKVYLLEGSKIYSVDLK